MRCSSCAAFVDDDATSCTSCGAEISAAPPPLPPEIADMPPPSDPGPSGAGGGGASAFTDSSTTVACDVCHESFPVIELERVHSQRMCTNCAARAEQPSRPSSGRVPKAATEISKSVSRAPLIAMGAAVVVLASVAVYFTVLNPRATSPTPGPNPTPGPAPAPRPAPSGPPMPAVPIPTPIQRPQDLTFDGVLQQWEPDGVRGNPKFLAFVRREDGHELRLSGVDKFLAGDLKVGSRYRISYRDIPSDDKVVEVKYSLKNTKIEPAK